jgi:RNase P/RNase MRP subunit p30
VARKAAKDNRVDLLNFPRKDDYWFWFDEKMASLARDSNIAYELNITDFLGLEDAQMVKVIKRKRRDMRNAERSGIPIVVSSGASEPLYMRGPRAMMALLDLLDIEEEKGREYMTKNPTEMVERNREKLGPYFISPGVWRVPSAS